MFTVPYNTHIFDLLGDSLFNDLTRKMNFLINSSPSFVEWLLYAGHMDTIANKTELILALIEFMPNEKDIC